MLLPLAAVALISQSISFSAAVAPRIEQFRFRFDNPSSFSTSELVPHFFEQRYDAIPVWFSAGARYAFAGASASTTISASLGGRTHGSDIDTFSQPGGDIVTSGTDGDVTLQSWALSQRVNVGAAGGWDLALTADYRRDHADFLPDDRIVTHSSPASVTRTFITDRETTVSQVLSLGVEASRGHVINERWHMTVGAGVQPVVRGRLLIQLPDKYPGVDLIFNAVSGGAAAHWTIERRAKHWHAGVTVTGAGVWAYRRSSTYALRGLGVSIFAGR